MSTDASAGEKPTGAEPTRFDARFDDCPYGTRADEPPNRPGDRAGVRSRRAKPNATAEVAA